VRFSRLFFLLGLVGVVASTLGCLGDDVDQGAQKINLTAEELLVRMESSDVESYRASYVLRLKEDGEVTRETRAELWSEGRYTYRLGTQGLNDCVYMSDGEKVWRHRPGRNEVAVAKAESGRLGYYRIPGLTEKLLRDFRVRGTEPNETLTLVKAEATVLRAEEYEGRECLVVRVERVPGPAHVTATEEQKTGGGATYGGVAYIWLEREHWSPLKISIERSWRDRSAELLLVYQNVTFGPSFPDDAFSFEAPEEAEAHDLSREPQQGQEEIVSFGNRSELMEAGFDIPLPRTPDGAEVDRIEVSKTGTGKGATTFASVAYRRNDPPLEPSFFFRLYTDHNPSI